MRNSPEPLIIFQLGAASIKAMRECNTLVRNQNLPIEMDHVPVLMHLFYNPQGSSQQRISQELQRDKASINRTVNFLSKIGIVKVEKDQKDKRATVVLLTEFGVEIAQEMVGILKEYEQSFIAALSREEQAQLFELLSKLIL